ncbi:uncharacterized protein LAESUDRAFT_755752 [Laetiporus sulphureus 93-53]|uniref:Alcohol dehydrogenase-like C-terminal domain-containing protein n=1 Tax=Laetiporus sulphureus 93-53 TaxID=1314785 RepID=A0A165GEN1_9APHY|nr:uncharacterized protein LAESUDRAFT_755752 [Laetiporus sulphureus 93-53]KZT10243.1 hypothetical protein LAESUDRAFT_755752 [Laetiporus sulphureus 93-53]
MCAKCPFCGLETTTCSSKSFAVIIGSFAQTHCFPRAVQYLDSGKIRIKGMVTDVFTIAEYQKALDKLNSREAVKIAVRPQ